MDTNNAQADEVGIAQNFTEAVDAFRSRQFRGNGLTEEEILERMMAFREKYAPEEPATEQELAEFAERLAEYYQHLREIGKESQEELMFARLTDDEDTIAGFFRSRMLVNPELQRQLQS